MLACANLLVNVTFLLTDRDLNEKRHNEGKKMSVPLMAKTSESYEIDGAQLVTCCKPVLCNGHC